MIHRISTWINTRLSLPSDKSSHPCYISIIHSIYGSLIFTMFKKNLLTIRVILGILLTGFLLFAIFVLIIWFRQPANNDLPDQPFMVFTIIPAATSTPLNQLPTPPPLSTTPYPSNTPIPGTIALNTYVQISGTGGDGLRIRATPGLSSTPLFFGNESEVFLVTDGPNQADGYTWWYLTAPYDQTRSGWAVANYLTFVPSP